MNMKEANESIGQGEYERNYAQQLASVPPCNTNQDGSYGKYLPPRELTDKEKEILLKLDMITEQLKSISIGVTHLIKR